MIRRVLSKCLLVVPPGWAVGAVWLVVFRGVRGTGLVPPAAGRHAACNSGFAPAWGPA